MYGGRRRRMPYFDFIFFDREILHVTRISGMVCSAVEISVCITAMFKMPGPHRMLSPKLRNGGKLGDDAYTMMSSLDRGTVLRQDQVLVFIVSGFAPASRFYWGSKVSIISLIELL